MMKNTKKYIFVLVLLIIVFSALFMFQKDFLNHFQGIKNAGSDQDLLWRIMSIGLWLLNMIVFGLL